MPTWWLLDPALPLGQLGPRLERPYGVLAHGAEVAVPGRVPLLRPLLGRVLRGADLVVAGGSYPATEARRAARRDLPTVLVPPGVDPERFVPLNEAERRAARRHFGLDPAAEVVLGLSRLVPRKGFDVLVEAGAALAAGRPDLQIVLAGTGRDRRRLERIATHHGSPVRFLGRVDEADIPALHAMADCFAMLCRDRWGGLEQEGFGIVFLEAAACGVPAVAGRSGRLGRSSPRRGHRHGGGRAGDVAAVALALDRILAEPRLGARLGAAGRRRVVDEFDYDLLARRLQSALEEVGRNT